MSRWSFSLASLCLILAGCENSGSDQTTLLESPILNRPIVAVVPLIDHSRSDVNWNLASELSASIRHRLSQKNRLYLLNEESVAPMALRCLKTHNPFDQEIEWTKKSFPQNEFVVFMELLEHREIPLYPTQEIGESPAELALTVRVRVFDLRQETPRVVLQEVVEQVHHLPKQFTKANFSQVPWGDETFETSPLGIAHDALCKELASRVEEYILFAGN